MKIAGTLFRYIFKKLFQVPVKFWQIVLLYSVLILIFYWQVFTMFFEGDEWFYFTQFLPFTRHWYGIFEAFYKSIADSYQVSGGGHLDPIYNVVWFLHNQFFGVHFIPYITCSLLAHIVNTCLVFIFFRKLTKEKNLAFVAGLFFGLSSIHQEAITWVMAYIPTIYSVTFLLLSLIFFLNFLEDTKHKTRNLIFCFINFLAAILTKESAVILFILLPFIWWLYGAGQKKIKKDFFLWYFGTLFFYLPYRFLLPKFFLWINSFGHIVKEPISPLQINLTIFRIFTYPLKALTEVFIPSYWITAMIEYITPLAYPFYGAEKAIRGTNFLIFTQGAGSDMIVYLFAFVFLFIIFIAIKCLFLQKLLLRSFFIGLAILLVSPVPLLAIATYSPGWGYVTFIDSRHLYISSIGASILFALAIVGLSTWISRNVEKKIATYIPVTGITGVLLCSWMIIQYVSLQRDTQFLANMGMQRRTILDKILSDIPVNAKNKEILVQSNLGYYGFGNIPPFQTNLGQALAVEYYERNVLPEFFIKSDFLTKHSLAGEGYINFENKGFGYFVDENDLLWDVAVNKRSPDDIYAFDWDGKTNTITNTTDTVRGKAREKIALLSQFADWHTYTDTQNHFSLKYPPTMTFYKVPLRPSTSPDILNDIILTTGSRDRETIPSTYDGLYMRIQMKQKLPEMNFIQFVNTQQNSDGEIINQDYNYHLIPLINSNVATTFFPTKGTYYVYYIWLPASSTVMKVTSIGDSALTRTDATGQFVFNKDLEKILSTIIEIPKE